MYWGLKVLSSTYSFSSQYKILCKSPQKKIPKALFSTLNFLCYTQTEGLIHIVYQTFYHFLLLFSLLLVYIFVGAYFYCVKIMLFITLFIKFISHLPPSDTLI